jgi:hypothetical protein
MKTILAPTPGQEKEFGDVVGNYLTQMHATFPLEVLKTSPAVAAREKLNANNLKNDPSRFIFATSPTVLVTIDGGPQMRPIENSSVMRIVNTPFALFFDRDSKNHLLRAGNDCAATDARAAAASVVAEEVAGRKI